MHAQAWAVSVVVFAGLVPDVLLRWGVDEVRWTRSVPCACDGVFLGQGERAFAAARLPVGVWFVPLDNGLYGGVWFDHARHRLVGWHGVR